MKYVVEVNTETVERTSVSEAKALIQALGVVGISATLFVEIEGKNPGGNVEELRIHYDIFKNLMDEMLDHETKPNFEPEAYAMANGSYNPHEYDDKPGDYEDHADR